LRREEGYSLLEEIKVNSYKNESESRKEIVSEAAWNEPVGMSHPEYPYVLET